MAASALRLVAWRDPPALDSRLAAPVPADRWPRASTPRSPFGAVLAVSIIVHASLIGWAAHRLETGEERSAGGAEETLVIEGLTVEILDSVPSAPSLPAATEVVAETADTVADAPTRAEAGRPPVLVEDLAAPAVADDAAPTASEAPATPVSPSTAELSAEAVGEIVPDDAQAAVVATNAAAIESAPGQPVADALARPVEAAAAEPVRDDAPAEPERLASPEPESPKPAEPTADTPVEPVADVTPRPIEPSPKAVDPAPDAAVAAVDVTEPAEPAKPVSKDRPKAKPAPASDASVESFAAPAAKAKGVGKSGGGGSDKNAAGKATVSSYHAKLSAHLKRFRSYPKEARGKKLTGTATVSFTVNAKGGVVSVRVVRSAGSPILDKAALAMVRKASPFPAIPAGLGSTVTIQAPIRFDLPR